MKPALSGVLRNVCDMGQVKAPDQERLVRTAWAKSWPMAEAPTHWLPVWQHLDDAADVAGLLWDLWLSPSMRSLVGSAFPAGEVDGRRFVRWIAGVHDVGKVSPAFASQVTRLSDAMRREGYNFHYTGRIHGHRHEDVSATALGDWLLDKGWDGLFTGQVTCLVIAHHGLFKSLPSKLRDNTVDVGDAEWEQVREVLLNRIAVRVGASERLVDWSTARLPGTVQMLVSGIVVMADWIASSDLFPMFDIEDVPPLAEVTAEESPRALQAFREVNLGGVWHPSPPVSAAQLMQERFPAITEPRAVQMELIEAAADADGTGLLILEAPMGIGKTEAALAAAEVLAQRFGCRGVFVALPTRATTDAMFSRVHDWLMHVPVSDATGTLPLALVHGTAAFNQEYQDLRFGRIRSQSIYDGTDAKGAGVGVAEWMTGRKRAALSSFVVSTIDHVLFAALKAKHVMLGQLSLAGKVVILDEVHAADPFMSIYLTRALEWMAAMGVPVILMTATLPGRMRAELYEAYQRGVARRIGSQPTPVDYLTAEIGYPAIVASRHAGARVTNPRSDHRRQHVSLRRLDDSSHAIAALLRERLADGGCAAVIRDTVGRAQETAAALEQVFGTENVTITHSCFLAVDRAAKDKDLLDRFGPPERATARPQLHIVVGTQVVEQSLDIDFDLMVTDIAPIDLVMQRIGRLHRHQRQRPSLLTNPECYITGVDWAPPVPGLDPGCRAVYRRYRLLASLAVLEPHIEGTPLAIPNDIPKLIHSAYSDRLDSPKDWSAEWQSARIEEAHFVAQQQDKADTFCLSGVMSPGKSLAGLTSGNLGNVDEDSHRARAAVRDGEDALQVVVVERRNGVDQIPSWLACGDHLLPIREAALPWEQSRLLAQCVLNLPRRLTNPSIIDSVIEDLERNYFPGWHASVYLRGQLALVLDEELRCELAGHVVRYDPRKGLMVEKIRQGQA